MKLITWKGSLQFKDCPQNEVRLATTEDIIAWIRENEAWEAVVRDWAPIKF